jgi:hypothetical protein
MLAALTIHLLGRINYAAMRRDEDGEKEGEPDLA